MSGVPNRTSYELHLPAEMSAWYSVVEFQGTLGGRLPKLRVPCTRAPYSRSPCGPWQQLSSIRLSPGQEEQYCSHHHEDAQNSHKERNFCASP